MKMGYITRAAAKRRPILYLQGIAMNEVMERAPWYIQQKDKRCFHGSH